MAICGQCGKTVKDDAKFCGGCGAKRTASPSAVEATSDLDAAPTAALVCPTCGKPLAKPGATFCGSCGANIEAPAGPVPPPPPQPLPPMVAPPPPVLQASAPPPQKPPQAAPPPPVPSAPKVAALPPASLPAPCAKKKGSPVLLILVIVALVGLVVLAAAGVGGYVFWKRAKAKAAAKLAEVTQQAEQQAHDLQAQAPETPQETPPEPTPSPMEPAPSQEMARDATATPSETSTSSRPKLKPPVASESARPADPTQDIQPDQVRTENLDKPLIAPAEPSPAPAVVQAAVLGLILESEAPGTKMVVKVDGTKVYEEDMPATKAATRIAKEFAVTAGLHHIRVAVWRPPQTPVAGEWDFTFEPGSHPVFRLDLKSNWKMEVKRFQ